MDLIAPLDPGWERALASQREALAAVGQNIQARRAAGEQVLPAPEHVLRAFRQPFEQVKVLILGQDPYHGPGQAEGLCFSVPKGIAIPSSLRNIYKEIGARQTDRRTIHSRTTRPSLSLLTHTLTTH